MTLPEVKDLLGRQRLTLLVAPMLLDVVGGQWGWVCWAQTADGVIKCMGRGLLVGEAVQSALRVLEEKEKREERWKQATD